MKHLFTILLTLAVMAGASAQAPYQLGDKVENFTLKDVNNKNVSLQDFADRKAVVVVFTNNLCPYAKLYENRLTGLSRSYAGRGVQFVFVNPSVNQQDGGESLQDMAAKATAGNYPFPYLADEGQKTSSRFGATKTPEVFVLHNLNGNFVLKYKGAIDDNPQAENFVKEFYLKNAIEAVLNNQPQKSVDRRATGCMIRKM
jgi:peroxiredoxin